MGKRKANSTIKGNQIDGNGNQVTVYNYPPSTPPITHVPVFDILQSKDSEIRRLENLINLLQDRVKMQSDELERLRGHISKKDNYINQLLFKQAS